MLSSFTRDGLLQHLGPARELFPDRVSLPDKEIVDVEY